MTENLPGIFFEKIRILLASIPFLIAVDLSEVIANKCRDTISEEANLDIGVVQGIVGLRWWDVEITGFTNHAGTTPMDRRNDAMLAASEFTLAVNEIVNSIEGTHVGTVGRIQAFPGVPNVIAGKVILSL